MSSESQNRFDRIVAILTQLQSTRVLKARDLAERFKVSLRTIYRDIRSLEAAGVPVSGEAGLGYSLMDGYRLPPVMFSREEASSFVAAEKLMQQFTDRNVRAQYESAMFKIKSVLRGNLKDHIDSLEAQIWVNPANQIHQEQSPDSLAILFESIAEKQQVRLLYQSFESDRAQERDIEPVGLSHEDHHWHVTAFCHLRNDYRQFRTDRIQRISRLTLAFTREHPPLSEFKKQKENENGRKVVIRIQKEIARYLRSGKKYYGIVSEQSSNTYVDLTFIIPEHSDSLARWYMMFGDSAEILEPESFRKQVRELANKLLANLHRPPPKNP